MYMFMFLYHGHVRMFVYVYTKHSTLIITQNRIINANAFVRILILNRQSNFRNAPVFVSTTTHTHMCRNTQPRPLLLSPLAALLLYGNANVSAYFLVFSSLLLSGVSCRCWSQHNSSTTQHIHYWRAPRTLRACV